MSEPKRHALKCELAQEVLRDCGQLRLQLMGWSMLPTIWPGDVVVIERAESSSVSRGDVVLFRRDERLFVHRVVQKNIQGTKQIRTQGDAMQASDPPVDERELLGKVSLITRNGRSIRPTRELSVCDRAIASLVRLSETGARVVVRVHGFIQN
jgi:signal peptidase I